LVRPSQKSNSIPTSTETDEHNSSPPTGWCRSTFCGKYKQRRWLGSNWRGCLWADISAGLAKSATANYYAIITENYATLYTHAGLWFQVRIATIHLVFNLF